MREVTNAYREERRQERSRRRLSYADRLRAFSNAEVMKPERDTLGMEHWYINPPKYLTFTEPALTKWFKEGEKRPCIMLGSIFALRMKGEREGCRRSYWAEEVLERQVERWLRKSRITCLSNEEWRGIVYSGFWSEKVDRLGTRYGRGKWCGLDWIYSRVNEFWNMSASGSNDGGYVLVNGERMLVNKEQLDTLREMHHLERKLRVAA